MTSAARARVLTAAMRLFGAHGYAATTVTQIEQAAGLSPGSGAIYRHFPTKQAILEAGVAEQIAAAGDLVDWFRDTATLDLLPLPAGLLVVARAGLRRLEQECDLNRLVLRDLAQFPDLLARVGNEDIARVFEAFAGWLRAQGDHRDVDVEAVAMVLMGAVTHLWIMQDVFGEHPAGVDEDRYLAAAVELAAALLSTGAEGER